MANIKVKEQILDSTVRRGLVVVRLPGEAHKVYQLHHMRKEYTVPVSYEIIFSINEGTPYGKMYKVNMIAEGPDGGRYFGQRHPEVHGPSISCVEVEPYTSYRPVSAYP